MRRLFSLITVCLAVLTTQLSARDQMRFERYTTADGLPGNRITSMNEDADGNIWMSTWNGICKWDGEKMNPFIATADGTRFGRTTGIQALRDGRVIFMNDQRERLCFDSKSQKLVDYPSVPDTVPQLLSEITCQEGETGLDFRRRGVTYHLPYDDGMRMEKQFHHMFEDKEGQVWFDFNNSLYRIWFEPSPFCFFQEWPEGKHCKFQSTVRSISTDENGNLLAASRNYKMYGLNDSVTDVPYPGNVYEMVSDTKFNRLWLALRKKGLYVNTPEGIRPAMDDLAGNGLSDLFSLLMLRDHPYLWCGTWGNGVQIVDVHTETPKVKRTLFNDSLTSIHKMIQLSNGLVGLCSTRGFHLYSASGVPVYVVASDIDIINAVELSDERVYLCTTGKGQFFMETNGRLVPDQSTHIEDRISTLYKEGTDHIWMTSDNRLFRYNYQEGTVDVLDSRDFGANVVFSENAVALYHDSLLYVGASSGMLEINLNEIDAYLAYRSQVVEDAHQQHIYRMSLKIGLLCLLVILLIVVAVIVIRYTVKRNVTKQIIKQQVSIADSDDILQNDREFVKKLTSIMNQMIGNQNADIGQLASMMEMPKNAFYVRCNEALHSTPAAILQDMRIEYSKKLLSEGNTSVKEVSFKVGFNDPKYFSKVFKAKVGMTPSQFLEKETKK